MQECACIEHTVCNFLERQKGKLQYFAQVKSNSYRDTPHLCQQVSWSIPRLGLWEHQDEWWDFLCHAQIVKQDLPQNGGPTFPSHPNESPEKHYIIVVKKKVLNVKQTFKNCCSWGAMCSCK